MKQLFFFTVLVVQFLAFGGSNFKSPFNDLVLSHDSTSNYRFVVSGHFHGSGTNRTGYPTNSLLANLDWLNQSESRFVMCLGDLFLDVSHDIPFYEQSFFKKLTIPLFNAVGNHDLTEQIYQSNFGETFYFFKQGNDIHLVLDTELDDGSIKGDQLDLLNQVKAEIEKGDYQHLFIYTHRTVWAKHYEALDGLFKDNTQAVFGNNFTDEIYPIIQGLGQKVKVFWYSGSLGNAPASFFYFPDETAGITYIATAIRGLKRDAVLGVEVKNGEVSFTTTSFTGEELMSLEAYDVAFWNNEVGEAPFNYRLIPYYLKSMTTHRYFWYGLLIGMSAVIFLRFFLKRRRIKRG